MFERNTFRKKAHDIAVERNKMEEKLAEVETVMLAQAKRLVNETGGSEHAKKNLWRMYAMFPQSIRVFTKDSTGQKTQHALVNKGDETFEEHHCETVLGSGELKRYKPWKASDVPCYFLQDTPVKPENFTIEDNGELKVIKKY